MQTYVVLIFLMVLPSLMQCASPILILKNCTLYDPKPMGKQDILIGGNKILAIQPATEDRFASIENLSTVINMNGSLVLPGLIDPHVHASGGGGELGPASRTPNAQLSQLVQAGITTIIGLRGTDSITRSAENLLQFLLSFEQMGLTSFMWTGSYHVPVDTLTSTVQRDIILVEKIIGAGEIAISDHRSSWPSYQQLVELVSNCRVAGMLSGKCGIAYFHVGSGPTMLDPLWEIVNKTTIPITQMYPTHMSSRGEALINEGKRWVAAGGFVDFTADGPNETDTTNALQQYRNQGVDLARVTISSDCYGSSPVYDSTGTLIAYSVASPMNLINQIKTLITIHGWSIDSAFSLATSNTANYLGFTKKGSLKVGNDADLIVLNPTTYEILYVVAMGNILLTPSFVAQAMFPCM